jgi:hypothetical protein
MLLLPAANQQRAGQPMAHAAGAAANSKTGCVEKAGLAAVGSWARSALCFVFIVLEACLLEWSTCR